jgi:hypothetical protein
MFDHKDLPKFALAERATDLKAIDGLYALFDSYPFCLGFEVLVFVIEKLIETGQDLLFLYFGSCVTAG